MMRGVGLVGLSEGLGLAERCGLNQEDFVNIFNGSSLNCEFLRSKAKIIVQRSFKTTEQSLQHFQNDMKLGLEVSNEKRQPMMMAATANQILRHTIKLGYGGYDAASIFMRNRH